MESLRDALCGLRRDWGSPTPLREPPLLTVFATGNPYYRPQYTNKGTVRCFADKIKNTVVLLRRYF